MSSGDLECSHEALDALRQTGSVQHLRGLLVLAEVLEPREEQLALFKRDIKVCLDEVTDPHDKTVLARYTRWHLMPLAHHRLERSGLNRFPREHLRRKLQTAHVLLAHIRRRGSTLDSVTQTLIDRWLIANKSGQNQAAVLAPGRHLQLDPQNVAIATATRTVDRSIMSDADRILTALRLETDESDHIANRVAGCLILRYGLRTDRLVKLTTDHVLVHPEEPGVLGLQLGRDPLWLRPQLSTASGGARHETEAYIAVFNVQEIEPGAYRYDTLSHGLVPVDADLRRAAMEHLTYQQDFFTTSSFGVITTALTERMAWKYPHPRAYKLMLHNVGHLIQVFTTTATALGYGAAITGAFRDTELEHALNITDTSEFPTFFMSCGTPQLTPEGLPAVFRPPARPTRH
ncbi:SagB/ThcOx family dehydrogenase [Streptomyces sp. NPDC058964]|uniref:SagB/ThcOx family dehydrogenase n=1 Tax=Streptomyces sp. NPDC058964 TaxID=3346681 RepID=UPI00369914C5